METQLTARAATRRGAEGVRALGRLLDELASTVIALDSGVYCARVASPVSGSIGEHVRHCLDHIAALVAIEGTTLFSYDSRQRGTRIETDPVAAVEQMLRLRTALTRWPTASLEQPVCLTSVVAAGETVTTWSTVGRELVFVLSHTIHHQAMIAVLLTLHQIDVPDRFGTAPSTPSKH